MYKVRNIFRIDLVSTKGWVSFFGAALAVFAAIAFLEANGCTFAW